MSDEHQRSKFTEKGASSHSVISPSYPKGHIARTVALSPSSPVAWRFRAPLRPACHTFHVIVTRV